ncbi:GntR family transcriptional regulator [Vibrio navarrensis]|uniref:GntR family transcriptional regulator n=2 Tax=Vibrio navarrensis TaxID=29495 RepID=A0AAI9G9Z6_9VIBR|nr:MULTISPECIES: GntR family transcriptional regulator [Vibrio]EGR2796372.1 GntR family transcriptional regulator [Vibrio navarrensis]EHA1125620.1 GntR family transcriptional regulator [Vibrio navarrensis]EKA5634630.1 GntR family transcriptional regulator [Vibrio navarrensis]ELN6933320.1 GntR family transcriptional regulator [Vibrio navarrensis]KJR31861.1 XRE family transcriptional regulator [Vibrio sp. S234-5]
MSSPTLTDKVSKMIRDDILSGALKPGQKLVVADLKAKYDVGASPIREALVQLSWTKYVKLEPQKGCWVAPMCKFELNDLYESLRVIASVLLKKAIACGDENWELSVLTSFHKLSKVQQLSDEHWPEWEERHHQFYTTLLAGSESLNMFEFFRDLINQIKRYRYFALCQSNSERQALFNIEEHEMIMKLVLAKNVEEATRLLDSHLLGSMKVIESAIEAA